MLFGSPPLKGYPTYPYISINDLPKIANLKRLFPEFYRADPVLMSDAKATQ
jgi:peptide-methionine (S)-S-oxide reductase